MAKSPIDNLIKNNSDTETHQFDNKILDSFNLKIFFKTSQSSSIYSYDLKDWCYIKCDKTQKIALPIRMTKMKNLFEWVVKQKKNKSSDSTILQKIRIINTYIKFCDTKALNPFSKIGYLAYVGNDGELWRQVNIFKLEKKFKFLYEDGEALGLKESSACNMKKALDLILKVLGLDLQMYQPLLHRFSKNNTIITTVPYLPEELKPALRRLNFYFTSLATQLIIYHQSHTTLLLPCKLTTQVDRVNNTDVTITCGSHRKGSGSNGYGNGTPFSQCMIAGYLLFSYYTAFNTSSIISLRHPIKSIYIDKEGRTSKFIKVKAYKSRAGKEVDAYFSSNKLSSREDNEKDFIVADILKRDRNGIQDGATFIDLMVMFSTTFSSEKNGLLFYDFDATHRKINLNIGEASTRLSENLGVFSSTRYQLADYFIQTFNLLINKQIINKYRVVTSIDSGCRVMSKVKTKVTNASIKKRAIPLAYAALSCLTDIPLKGITMPISFSDIDKNGEITIDINYEDGTNKKIKVDAKYKLFFKSLVEYSNHLNPVSNPKVKGGGSRRVPYLLPLGNRYRTYQWESVESLIKAAKLNEYGLSHGDFLLSFSASRMRVTTSYQEYDEDDKGYGARAILQHSIDTQSRIYTNGHPIENRRNASQSLQILKKIAEGQTRESAINELKSDLNITIISYEQYKRRSIPTNPNGISCDSTPDVNKNVKNLHYPARKFASENKIIEANGDIPCYQYDLCIFCKNAQIVDDAHAIYKLLSFISALSDVIDLYPERTVFFVKKIDKFKSLIELVPVATYEAAKEILAEKGIYFMFSSKEAVLQYI